MLVRTCNKPMDLSSCLAQSKVCTSALYCKFNHCITTERESIFNSWFRKRLNENCPHLISESIQSIKSLAQQASQNLKKVSSYPIKKIQICLSILNIGLIMHQETACKSTIKPRGFPTLTA